LDKIADVEVNVSITHCTLSYSAVKLFSKYSNLYDHDNWTSRTDRQTDRRADRRRDRRHTVA